MRPAVLITALLLAACAVEPADETSRWSVDHLEDGGAVLSVWGAGPDDVWAVGGQVGRGLLLHNDGSGWARREVPAATELLWWVYGFKSDDVYAVGEGGLVLHYDGTSWTRIESGTDAPLYGLWGASGDDVWIAGGDPMAAPGSAVVLRGQSGRFEPVALPAELAPSALFKIYGFHDQVIAVGDDGAVLRRSGELWQRDPVPTDAPLFSMWGRAANDLYAAGGYAQGELLHFDGDSWQRDEGAELGPVLSGVYTAPGQPVIAVGEHAYVLEIDADGRIAEPALPPVAPLPSLHAVWGDGAGTVYAVGGDLGSYPDLGSGVIYRRQ